MRENVNDPLTKVYYNESCSICRFEINHYKKFEKKIGWVDVTNNKSAVDETKKQPTELIRRLHVLKDGQIYNGIDAFLIVWEELPKYKWLYNLVKTPIIYHISYIAYECLAYLLYLKNKGQLKNE